ncbi:MAG: Fe-S cluster assembly ATPase SufC [Actinobacteria bacterium]|nr:Fe-S cluster assembly ATPase SufC [Actinomycetota bacterium]
MAPLLTIQDLHASGHEGAGILRGVTLTVAPGELHALMGPNGSGKSTLANVLMGNPGYEVTSGSVNFKGVDLAGLGPDDRSVQGLFLGFQYPEEIPGVTMINFLRRAISARKDFDISVLEVRLALIEWMQRLGMDAKLADRYLNQGFSGGEKKRNEILQMALLEPDLAILDETDSGLDIDALKTVAAGVEAVRSERPEMAVLLITHYQRILKYLAPDVVHVLVDGRIVASGGMDLVEQLERDGYEGFREPAGADV